MQTHDFPVVIKGRGSTQNPWVWSQSFKNKRINNIIVYCKISCMIICILFWTWHDGAAVLLLHYSKETPETTPETIHVEVVIHQGHISVRVPLHETRRSPQVSIAHNKKQALLVSCLLPNLGKVVEVNSRFRKKEVKLKPSFTDMKLLSKLSNPNPHVISLRRVDHSHKRSSTLRCPHPRPITGDRCECQDGA